MLTANNPQQVNSHMAGGFGVGLMINENTSQGDEDDDDDSENNTESQMSP
jgi:hypothetical protein